MKCALSAARVKLFPLPQFETFFEFSGPIAVTAATSEGTTKEAPCLREVTQPNLLDRRRRQCLSNSESII